ncbi:MAG: hypothetical protein WKG07_03630 [Hymenobacter sp.]
MGFAQGTSSARWQQHADSIFQHINRSPVTTGILTNYGFAFRDYNQFQGTALTASNQMHSLVEWRLLYTAMQTSIFNSSANLPTLATANQRIAQVQQQYPAAIPIATLLARYNRFSDDAGTAGLVTVSNKQLYDNPNRTRSPYERRILVAMCPLQTALATRTPQFILPWQLSFTNAVTTRALEVDAGDGQGYRSIGWDPAHWSLLPCRWYLYFTCSLHLDRWHDVAQPSQPYRAAGPNSRPLRLQCGYPAHQRLIHRYATIQWRGSYRHRNGSLC